MEFKRSDRVSDQIHREIADIVLRRVKDPRVANLTITGVEVTPDLQHARVFFCIMGGTADESVKKNAISGLENAKGFIRQELGKRLRLRYVPQFNFEYDISFDYGDKIERLLKELPKDD
jgi:ribosome-binding factor A